MSYRPNYSESWRPPPRQSDNWRPSAQHPDFDPDRHQNGAQMRYGEDGWPYGERRMFPSKGDSWRPQRHEEYPRRSGDEHHDHGTEDASRGSYHEDPLQRRDILARSNLADPVRSQSNLNPVSSTFQPGMVPQRSSFNGAVPASLRSANSSNSAARRKGGDNPTVVGQETARSHRYSLRSKQPGGTSSGISGDVSMQLGYSNQKTHQPGVGSAEVFNLLQSKHGRKRPMSPVVSPPAPSATDLYLAQARLPLERSATAKKLLVVLDLNGTLLVRPSRNRPRDFHMRPGVHQLLDYLFDHHVVMVYSSAQPANVEAMVDSLVDKKRAQALAAIWGRDKLDLTPIQYKEKVQVYKKLERVWGDEQIQASCLNGPRWSQANTVLVDDSHVKALSQPHNLIQVPAFDKYTKLTKEERRRELEIVASIRAKLEDLKWSNDVSRHILRWQTGEMEPPRASKLSPLPKLRGGENGGVLVETGQDDPSIDTMMSLETDDVQAALGRDMQNLTTGPSAGEEDHAMNQPAISAEEWKDFLK